jgi:hypothetical protein
MTGPLTSVKLGAAYQVDQFPGADFGAKLNACLSGLTSTNGGTCDARNFSGIQSMGSNLTISTADVTVQLPCATISTANQLIVTAGTRNVSLRGCALRGASAASGSQGGTVFLYSGSNAMLQVGDPTYAADTSGFHLDNAVINTTASTSSAAQGFIAYRAQELDLESLYFLGNSNQTGMTLNGTGNYTGGTFVDNEISGFLTAVNAIGHQIANSATTDWMNASTFLRMHIDCPTSGGSPISGSYGINLQQGDGNTITGGDVEGCSTALHLGANAQNNTIVGLRNENSTNQVVADAGSSYNSWLSGGTIFTGQLTDNGTRNSFLDTFHRSFNGLNGDWYGSQKDATVTNHYRLGIGAGNERGLMNEIQTDYGYRWLEGYSDAAAGEQFYQINDLLNSVNRVSIGQYNNGQSSTNNQTVINAAGTGAVVLNGSNNAGTGGVVIGSGGASESTVATISNAGNAQFNGTLQAGGATQSAGTMTVRNNADSEVDYYLWPGLTASQKGSYTYKDWNGNSQWYMVKDASNNWALNSATGGLDSFKAYQSTNSGDTYINSSNASGVVRVNYESGAGTAFNIYGGGSNLYASFTGAAAIKFPGLAATSGHNCLQIDNSGYITNTGSGCSSGSTNGTVNAGTTGQIAYYNSAGTALSGISTVSVSSGGTGSSTTSGALTNLGAAPLAGAAFTGPVSVASTFAAQDITSIGPLFDVTQFGATGNGSTDDTAAIQAAFNACVGGATVGDITGSIPGGIVEFPGAHTYAISSTINAYDGCLLEGGGSEANKPTVIKWNGPAVGTAYSTTGFTAAANASPYTYTAAFPQVVGSPQNRAAQNVVTFTGTNSLSANQWVSISGCTTAAGRLLNRAIGQVASATSTSAVVAMPEALTLGTYTDTCTLTTASVAFAFDASAHFNQSVSNLMIQNGTNTPSVDLFFGSRVDTGTRIWNVWASSTGMYGYYFAQGGINVDFDKGWRADNAGISGIYWRLGGGDNLELTNGTVPNTSYGSGMIVLDNVNCDSINLNVVHVDFEADTALSAGNGMTQLYGCQQAGSSMNGAPQFFLNYEEVNDNQSALGGNPFIYQSPANDNTVDLTVINSNIAGFTGIPSLQRYNIEGTISYVPFLAYAPSQKSILSNTYNSAIQLIGDVNVSQLWQYGIQASDFLYSDPAFAALPNATTLFAGQILAPPSYWSGSNGKRYALDVVYQAGTTGTPNSGATTCTGTTGTNVLTCTSATDLSAGQRISIGSDTNRAISSVNAANPSAVLVYLGSNLASTYSTATTLSFTAPVLGPEIQMPTKSASAPTTLAWSQGDMEQNSGATANGVAAWVNVAGGTPGTWAGIPLGNSSGQIATSQIASTSLQGTDSKVMTAGTISGTGSLLCTDANGGATTAGCAAASNPINSYNGGDVLCAHGGDTANLSNAITAGTATSLTVATLPNYMKIPGTVIGVTGATPSGLNGTYAVTSVSSNTMNFASLGATWTSGGTVYLACLNSTDDTNSVSPQYFTNNTYAASLFAGQTLTQKTQYAYGTTATAPTWTVEYKIGTTNIFGEWTPETLYASASGLGGVFQLGLSSPATGWVDVTKDFALFGLAQENGKSGTGTELSNVASGTLETGGYFTATGLGSITSYTSGATVTGSIGQTCTLGTFNSGLTGAAVTATLTTANTLSGATFVVTNTGYGATAAATTATVSSGSATCSGTGTFVTVLGGAQGNWIMLRSMKTSQ